MCPTHAYRERKGEQEIHLPVLGLKPHAPCITTQCGPVSIFAAGRIANCI